MPAAAWSFLFVDRTIYLPFFYHHFQPINMSATSPSQTVFSIGYDFHLGGSDNGNVWGIINNKDTTRNQSFTYDALNRLTSAQNAGTNCSATTVNGKTEYWGNSYGYDAFGNLLQKTVTKCNAENLSVAVLANNQLTGYGYDAAGNMTSDPTDGVTSTYDPENRIATATKNGVTTAYTYDDDGNRVEKTSGSTGTLYGYMSPGIVAESDLAGNLQSEYVFFDGERVARRDNPTSPNSTVSYYFSDHLKTASVITDSVGNIKSESDYYPWGGELQFANNDSNHYKFTGKERDLETGLDYFGARYYSNGLGRWLTPDWAAKAAAVPYAEFADPQSLNLYSYVRNVPTTRYDADGHCPDACVVEGGIVVVSVGIVVQVVTAVGIGLAAGWAYDKITAHHLSKPSPGVRATSPQSTPAVPPPPPLPVPPKQQDKINKQRAQFNANKAQGKAFENQTVEATKATDNNVAEQVTLKTDSGLKTRMDVVSEDQSGTIRLQEAKSSATAPVTDNQAAAHAEIENSGATVAGEGKPGYPGGTQIPPTKVEITRPPL